MENINLPPDQSSQDPLSKSKKPKIKKSTIIIIIIASILLEVGVYVRNSKKEEQKIANDLVKFTQDIGVSDELGIDDNKINSASDYNFGALELITDAYKKLDQISEKSVEIFDSYLELEDVILVNPEASKQILGIFKKDWKAVMDEEIQLFDDLEKNLENYSTKDKNEKGLIKGALTGVEELKQTETDAFNKATALFSAREEQMDYLINNKDLYEYDDIENNVSTDSDQFEEGYNQIVEKFNTANHELKAFLHELEAKQEQSTERFNNLLDTLTD